MTNEERDARLKLLCSEIFLHKLAEVAKLYGWDGDYQEIWKFLDYLFKMQDLPVPDLEPYKIEYDDRINL